MGARPAWPTSGRSLAAPRAGCQPRPGASTPQACAPPTGPETSDQVTGHRAEEGSRSAPGTGRRLGAPVFPPADRDQCPGRVAPAGDDLRRSECRNWSLPPPPAERAPSGLALRKLRGGGSIGCAAAGRRGRWCTGDPVRLHWHGACECGPQPKPALSHRVHARRPGAGSVPRGRRPQERERK
jgi:hypothetical protein